jgi:hypothetical protein
MSQPTFTLWPWKILSMLVPAMAMGAAALAVKNNAPTEDSFAIFFGVIAAGNAYLFAMAIGDFGRSVVAIPIGAVAGWLAVVIFSYTAPSIMFFLVLGLGIFSSVVTRSSTLGQSLLAMALLLFLALGAVGGPNRADPIRSAIAGYPFVCAAVAGCMPLRRDAYGVWLAAMAGARAALHGMVAGGFVFFVTALMSRAMISLRVDGVIAHNLPVILAGMFMNYYCVKYIFTAVHRVVAPVPLSAAPQDDVVLGSKEGENLTPIRAPERPRPDGGVEAFEDSE